MKKGGSRGSPSSESVRTIPRKRDKVQQRKKSKEGGLKRNVLIREREGLKSCKTTKVKKPEGTKGFLLESPTGILSQRGSLQYAEEMGA